MSSEWDQRELCPDGSCIGVIGADGVCKTCGRVVPNWGDPRRAPGQGAGDEPRSKRASEAPASSGGPEWTERALCPDGGCIGVIGADGHCKVCGKAGVVDDDHEDDDEDDEDYDDDEVAADDSGDDEDDDDEDDGDGDDDDEDGDDDDEDGDDRRLCPDGACVGLIGPDNRCKVCGKAAA